MKTFLSLLILVGCLVGYSSAQSQTVITGVVKGTDSSLVSGAAVTVSGTTNGTVTDASGHFSISVPNLESVLDVSSIGFSDQTVHLDGKTFVYVVMKSTAVTLSNLVIIGYGSQKKGDLSSAVSSINVENLQTNAILPNAAAALEGTTPGVSITVANGAPGAPVNVHVRGTSTFGDAQPLVIIDGAPGDLNNVNPDDIASIQVLKDAASAAIYGSRAANGVLIVTTKNGKEGPTRISFNATYGNQSPKKFIPVANAEQYAEIDNALHNSVGLPPFPALSNPSSLGKGTDWQRTVYGNAPILNSYLGVSGGSKNSTYQVSGSYTDQDGIARATWYKKALFHFGGQQKKGPVTFGESINWVNSNQRTFPGGGDKDLTQQIILAQPIIPVFDPTNEGGFGGAPAWLNTQAYNPYGLLKLQDNTNQINDYNMNIYGSVRFLKYFTYKLNTGYRVINGFASNFFPTYYMSTQRQNIHASLSENRSTEVHWIVENTLNFQRILGKNNIEALVGVTNEDDKTRNTIGTAQGFPNNNVRVLSATTGFSVNSGGNEFEWSMASLLGRVLYSYDSKYYLTANVRRDGSSRFGSSNRYGVFPSVSAAWRISRESFFDNSSMGKTFQDLKLRGSYGELGNQPGLNYSYIPAVTFDPAFGYLFGSTFLTGAAIEAFANPNIKWESTKDLDIGLDADFLSNWSVTLDYYVDKTRNVLLQVPIPPSTGTSVPPVVNTGRIQNNGFEGIITYHSNAKPNGFKYNISLNFSTIRNKVLELGFEDEVIYGDLPQRASTNPVTAAMAGYPIGAFFVKQADGLFQSDAEVQAWKDAKGDLIQPSAQPGDVRYKDINGDGVINGLDVAYSGSPFPKLSYGLNFNASYKNFDFTLFVQGNYGNKMFDTNTWLLNWGTIDYNFTPDFLNAWSSTNTHSSVPRLSFNDPNHNADPSTRFLYSASYFRFKTLQLGYTFPKDMLSSLGITNFRVFASANNLWTISKYPGYDPSYTGDGLLNRGLDQGLYPVARIISGGLSLNF